MSSYPQIYDHIRQGKTLQFFETPPPIPNEVESFSDGLKQIIPEKLDQLLIRCAELKAERNAKLDYASKRLKPGSLEEHFFVSLIFHEFSEYYIIQKWIKYWVELWYKTTHKSLPTPVAIHFRPFLEKEIGLAKQKPIIDLYDGRLRKSGSRFTGLCPFHKEKTPSFVIYPNNTFHCFGCNAHGDVISFVMVSQEKSFAQAVRSLL